MPCQGRWHHSQPAMGQQDGAWDARTSQCHPMKLPPQVTPQLAEQQVPIPLGSPSAQTLPTGFPGKRERGDGTGMLHPLLSLPTLGMFSCTPGYLLLLPSRAGK